MNIFKNAVINGVKTDFGVENGRFAFVEPTSLPGTDLQGREVTPGFIDIHTHGCLGHDTMDGPDAVKAMSRFYLQNGVTSFYPTTMSAPKEQLQAVTAMLPETEGAAPLGYHLEGPFLSVAYKGAQAKEPIEAAALSDLNTYGNIGLITVAPEFPAIQQMIEHCGVPVCLGHTGCDYDTAMQAFESGAKCVTHIFNAMTPLHHRQPGLIGAAVMQNAYVQVICDGIHLHPAIIQLLYRTFGPKRMILISDSMRATGLNDGAYELGGQAVTVKSGIARLADGTIAGSTATLLHCVKQAIKFGIPKQEALRMVTETPAAMLGLNKGKIQPGFDADFVVFSHDFTPCAAMVRGQFIKL